MQFNEKLKKLRADKGLSQEELAKKIFVSRRCSCQMGKTVWGCREKRR